MACDNNYRLAWLVNTLLEKPYQTRKELEDQWLESGLANGKPLARRTFIDHIESVKEVFGYEIKWKIQGKTTDITSLIQIRLELKMFVIGCSSLFRSLI